MSVPCPPLPFSSKNAVSVPPEGLPEGITISACIFLYIPYIFCITLYLHSLLKANRKCCVTHYHTTLMEPAAESPPSSPGDGGDDRLGLGAFLRDAAAIAKASSPSALSVRIFVSAYIFLILGTWYVHYKNK